MDTILTIGGSDQARAEVRLALEQAGYAVEATASGAAGLAVAARGGPALVILDVALPDLEGFEACRRLRGISDVPLILLTAGTGQPDRVVGLELGADDCLTKPVGPRELAARVKAILRRGHGQSVSERLLTVGDLELDLAGRTASVRGQALPLRAREFDLLVALAGERGAVVPRARLLDVVWGVAPDAETRTLDVHIARLREQLVAANVVIETVRGIGYRLAAGAGAHVPLM